MLKESYRSFFNSKGSIWMLGADGVLKDAFNSLINFTLDFDRIIYSIFEWLIETIANPTFFENLTIQMTDMTKTVFNNMYDNLLIYVFVLVIAGMVVAFSKRRLHDVFKVFMEFVIVLFLALFFIHNTTPVIQGSFDVMDEVSATVITGVTFKKDITNADEQAVGTDALVEQYKAGLFREIVEDPWAIINFGKSYNDSDTFKDKDGKDHTMKDFLIEEDASIEEMQSRSREIEDLVNNTPNLWFIDNLGTKLLIGFFSCFNAVQTGTFVTFSVLLIFFLKIGIMCLFVILPVILFLEMIPAFRGTLTKFVGIIVNLFMQSMIMQLVIFILLFFFSVLNSLVTGVVSYLAVLVLKLLIVGIGWKLFPKLLMLLGVRSSAVSTERRLLGKGVRLGVTSFAAGVGAGATVIERRREKKEMQRQDLEDKAVSARGLIHQTNRLKAGISLDQFKPKDVSDSTIKDTDRIYKEVKKPEVKDYANYKMVDPDSQLQTGKKQRSNNPIPVTGDVDALPVVRGFEEPDKEQHDDQIKRQDQEQTKRPDRSRKQGGFSMEPVIFYPHEPPKDLKQDREGGFVADVEDEPEKKHRDIVDEWSTAFIHAVAPDSDLDIKEVDQKSQRSEAIGRDEQSDRSVWLDSDQTENQSQQYYPGKDLHILDKEKLDREMPEKEKSEKVQHFDRQKKDQRSGGRKQPKIPAYKRQKDAVRSAAMQTYEKNTRFNRPWKKVGKTDGE